MTRKEILIAYKEGKLSLFEVREKLRRLARQSGRSALSEGQKGLWALQKIAPESSAYNIPLCFRVSGKLHPDSFKKACSFVVEQYPVLDSAVREENGVPYRTVCPSQSPDFRQEDASGLKKHEILSYLRKKAKEPFSLENGPLLRVHFVSLSEQEHYILIVIHHIVFDGFSTVIFLESLLNAYSEFVLGKVPQPVSSVYDYNDYVEWEQNMLVGKEKEEQCSYWKRQLSGELPVLEIPADRPRPGKASFAGETHTSILSPALSKKLRALARAQNVNMSVFLLGIYKLLLYRYSGQEDIIVGMPVMVRPREEFSSQIGFFINMIPVRSRIAGTKPFANFLQELKATLADGLDHSAYPFPVLVRDLNVPRISENYPVFQTAFAYQNFDGAKSVQQLLKRYRDVIAAEPVPGIHQEGEYELELEVFEQEDGFMLNFKYDPGIFDSSTIARLSGHFHHLVKETVKKPATAIDDYSLLSEQEKRTVLYDWNATEASYPADKCFHVLFEEQARKTPNETAVFYENEFLTYQQLDEKSALLAAYLQAQGVRPDCLVGICVERSLDMVVGLLGILKAGGAYVPLEADFPAERLEYMLRDSKAPFILTQSGLADKVSRLCGENVKTIVMDKGWEEIAKTARGIKKLKREVRPQHLAYVMYTSGSTGRPKGVMVTHQGLTNFLTAMAGTAGLAARDTLLAVTTYCFDIAGLELYLPLLSGAKVCICSSEKAKDAEKLKLEIERVKPAVMQATPATWTMLFHAGWRNEEKVRVLCGGEALSPALKNRFMENRCDVWNLFGPTETTIWSTAKHITPAEPVTIGKPIANTQVYILDKNLKPVPVGIPGELCIAGDGVARGYLNMPELTAQKFVANPFTPGKRMYRTGDLARWLPNGEIEFLGRVDFQVKIRGFRIEPGEIELRLRAHPGVKDCVVVVKEEENSKQLVAYYVPEETGGESGKEGKNDERLGPQRLREYLRLSLPEYMIPSFFIQLDEIPLTPNGKVDRKNLMARKLKVSRTARTSTPQSAIEEKLLGIWKGILHVDDISTEDGFFDAGGDSVSAVAVVERIRKEFDCDIPVTSLFKYSNIKEMSSYIGEIKGANAFSEQGTPAKYCGVKKSYPDYYRDSLAIIGISCHFPGAKNRFEFWNNLRLGQESVRFFSKEELSRYGLPAEVLENPRLVPAQFTIEGKELFDPGFFNIPPKDAEFMDPQLRLLLLHSWKAIEDAGYIPGNIPQTGVFMAASNSLYQALFPFFVSSGIRVLKDSDEYVSWLLAQGGTIPAMISHRLGLKGPSFFVHSNCSSSLVGLYSACQSLRAGEARYALVGAATVYPSTIAGYVHQPGLNFSGDGHVKTFDASADGMVAGEGVAVILLKNALEAINDGDHIYALLRGISVNNDGAEKVGFYAPSVKGQAEVIKKALETTGVHPESITYVEAHGTGTKLGDPIEFAALCDAYRQYTAKTQFCGIGSVKTNIGHLDTAAGLAGCIKVALSLYYGEIPPSINCKVPNPNLEMEKSPFYLVDKLNKFENAPAPIRAALSSMGMGGTNSHAIFEQYINGGEQNENDGEPGSKGGPYLVPLSAKNRERLIDYAGDLLGFLAGTGRFPEAPGENSIQPPVCLADLAYTLQVGREAMENRVVFVVSDRDELRQKLKDFIDNQQEIEGCFRGEIKRGGDNAGWHGKEEDCKETIAQCIAKGELKKVASLWAKGINVNWELLYPHGKPRRVSLPTYPFAQESYWPRRESGSSPEMDLSSDRPLAGAVMLVPAWETVLPAWGETIPAASGRLVIAGGDEEKRKAVMRIFPAAQVLEIRRTDTVEEIAGKLKAIGPFDHVVWLSSNFSVENMDGDSLLEGLEEGVFQVFRLVKSLLGLGYGTGRLGLTFVTVQAQPVHNKERVNPTQSAVHGFIGSLAKEYPGWMVRLVDLEEGCSWPLEDMFKLPPDTWGEAWFYRDEKWHRQKLVAAEGVKPGQPLYKPGGVYVVIGGAGGIGELWSEYMIRHYRAQVFWLGRRKEDQTIRAKLDRLAGMGPAPQYITADATDREALQRACEQIKQKHPKINGVVHSAVGSFDQSLASMDEERFRAVLAAKVDASVRLAQVFGQESIDFLLFFSSLNAFIKEHGKSGYSAGCAFMDAFAHQLSSEWNCAVKVMDWGYWGDVGAGAVMPEAFKKRMGQYGIEALEPAEAMKALELLLNGPLNQVALMKFTKKTALPKMSSYGPVMTEGTDSGSELKDKVRAFLIETVSKLRRVNTGEIDAGAGFEDYGFDLTEIAALAGKLNEEYNLNLAPRVISDCKTLNGLAEHVAEELGGNNMQTSPKPTLARRKSTPQTDQGIEFHVRAVIRESTAGALKIDEEQISEDLGFSEFGVDSIIAVNLVNTINKKLNTDLQVTVLFDYSNVNKLARYIVENHKSELASLLPDDDPGMEKDSFEVRGGFEVVNDERQIQKDAIAIIGMSGLFAGSKTVNELWEHLANGDDLVEEITRWNLAEYFAGTPLEKANYCKYGSFIDDFDCFDPAFFNISVLEATYMDPRQRLFLEESWKALEDAGYAGEELKGRSCGVYVGCGAGDYHQFLGKNPPAQAFWGNDSALIPARISYYLDILGPAVAVDTACSSSLVAVHLACQGLWSREIDLALAGGVYINCTPGIYLPANRAGMLSPTGRCYTFDERADGFVPGEGVGVVVLKRLSEAVADGDHIHGVIRGTGINQDGATNGIIAPSADSQERLERYVYDNFNINPAEIQMVEAHGTGTKLGDPIEYQALTRAFRHYTSKREYCAIGSIKSNLGHTIYAAGIAGVIKILLSLKHKKIPPSLHFRSGNPLIQFKGSPFYVNTALKDWDVGDNSKRCAAVSSFGLSGTNAHMVIEEAPRQERRHAQKAGYLIVLSAGSARQLEQQAEQMIDYCEREPGVDCGNMSYTLLLGRKHLNHRLACIARTQQELAGLLKKWLKEGRAPQVYHAELPGTTQQEQPSIKRYGNQCLDNCRNAANNSDYLESLSAVAELYAQGYNLEFKRLFAGDQYCRIPLPTYPFARERYWIQDVEDGAPAQAVVRGVEKHIHPLLHRDTSDLMEQRFSSTFSGHEFFLADHRIKGRRILPAAAHLEMARAAVEQAAGFKKEGITGIRLKNIVWSRPLVVGEEPKGAHISLRPEANGKLAFEIYGTSGEGKEVYSQGSAEPGIEVSSPSLSIEELKSRCGRKNLPARQYYEAFTSMGIDYGPGHRGLEEVYMGEGEALAKLSLPGVLLSTSGEYVLHPSLVDAAFQATLGLTASLGVAGEMKPALPFALRELEIYERCGVEMWAYLRFSDKKPAGEKIKEIDIDLCDDRGRVCARLKGYASRVLDKGAGLEKPAAGAGAMTAPIEIIDRGGEGAESELKERAIQYLKALLAGIIKLPAQKIEEDAALEKYGIDSLMAMQMTGELEKAFGPLPK
ncbi:MAG: amino acid adenylation domain-containing protein, partial [Peptococcaceae bacterium]|nr:amino acid adenylation domain-containing protein [Peptococcaceae bacterium]